MREYKLGPKNVTTLRDGLVFVTGTFVKGTLIIAIVLLAALLLGHITASMRHTQIVPGSEKFCLGAFVFSIVLYGWFLFQRAKRTVFWFFQLEESAVSFYSKKSGMSCKKKVPYERISQVGQDRACFDSASTCSKSNATVGWIRFQSDNFFGLDGIISLGVRTEEEMKQISSELLARNAKIIIGII